MNEFSYLFLLFLTLSTLLTIWLNTRQTAYVQQHRNAVPNDFKEKINLEAHQKAADYTLAKIKVSNVSTLVSCAILIALTLGGLVSALSLVIGSYIPHDIYSGVALMMSIFILSHFIELPIEIYQVFKVEQAFGFNRSNASQFIKDQLIQLSLMLMIGAPFLYALLWVMEKMGNYWWLYAALLVISFTFLMTWLVPTLIAPLFNKFTPLEDGDLKQRIQQLFEQCGFQSKGIYVMDGSRRSGHGNAYFTGLGRHKRIVFYDTLIDSLNTNEIEAVLAHELGHFKCKHISKQMRVSTLMTVAGFALLGWLSQQEWFYAGLGVEQMNPATALLLFILILPVFTFFLQPISSYFQRKFEFEADAFASTMSHPEYLIQALVKLYKENASTLTPDPLYSKFHHSHPSASTRINHLKRLTKEAP
ncbi:MAG: M48 family metallopeptidase [Cycloclasticus sp.]|nr:M48 family metallopeptidase [Cycloclasticus sp.]